MKYIIVALLWSGFAFIHSFLISKSISDWSSNKLGEYFKYYRLAYNTLALGLFFVLALYTRKVDQEVIISFLFPWNILQYFLLAGSVLLMIWAFKSYDALEFFGFRQIIRQRLGMGISQGGQITRKGLLGIVRHPLYLGTIIFLWSLNSTGADIVVHIVLTIYILIGIKLEEKKLVDNFGESYIKYQQEVPALIPYLNRLI